MNEASEIETRPHEDKKQGPVWLPALQLEKWGRQETGLRFSFLQRLTSTSPWTQKGSHIGWSPPPPPERPSVK